MILGSLTDGETASRSEAQAAERRTARGFVRVDARKDKRIVSIERFIECPCGHTIELHEANGCVGSVRYARRRCTCALTRSQVLDLLLDAERETIRRAWHVNR